MVAKYFSSYLANRFQLNNPADTPRGPNLEASASKRSGFDFILFMEIPLSKFG